MIVKHRNIPLKVHFNQALARRLPIHHPKLPQIENDSRMKMSGHHGEVQTDFHLQFLDDKEHFIFRGLRLPHSDHHFQIDTLILSRKFIPIIETKNMGGSLNIDWHQFSRSEETGEKGYNNPLLQVTRHKEQFQDWLASHRFERLPIFTQVILSNPSAVIRTKDSRIHQAICKIDRLKSQILKQMNSCSTEFLSDRDIRKLCRLLLKEDSPYFPSLQTSYGICPSDLKGGVGCPSCCHFGMIRHNRLWLCPNCLFQSRDAHQDAVLDYFLLIKPTMTNRAFRDFTGISSIKVASNLLAGLNLPSTGSKKGCIYHRPPHIVSLLEERYLRAMQKTRD
ncbi:nuclease-related domain-containing protein [Bacillus sp. FJAT-27251]|uniref:nuclease-related domain-containing protein n=1 Tax=Bacillus sp. FJAT-27251 TaxID=1684142 RepID=UPI0006A77844|nr:nuclease-related domain-containing protein [Bacillus sp. FJAT-27251]